MAKTNYSFEKRQKEIAKKQKQEEKRQRKLVPQGEQPQEGDTQEGDPQEVTTPPPVDGTV